MIWKLLRKNISIAQILGYALANLVGLAIVLSAIKFYGDVSAALGIAGGEEENDGKLASKDYLVISRPVSMLSTFGMGKSNEGISDEDIDALRSQPWAKSVGIFTSANFSVTGSVDFHGQGMWTYLFLEAVPNQFLDINPSDWHFDPSDPNAEVPIIISKALQLWLCAVARNFAVELRFDIESTDKTISQWQWACQSIRRPHRRFLVAP